MKKETLESMKTYKVHPDLFGLIAEGAYRDVAHYEINPNPRRGFHLEHTIIQKITGETFQIKLDEEALEKILKQVRKETNEKS